MEHRYSKQWFTVNGKTYSSPDEMPAEERKIFESTMAKLGEDKDHNGIPDVLEGKSVDGVTFKVQRVSSYMVNGVKYNSLEEMPAEVRERFQRAQLRARTDDELKR